jgi:serine/threonine-protein kinase
MAAAQGDAPPRDFVAPPPPTTTTTVRPLETTTIPGEGLLPVPDVRGKSYSDAARAIQQAGFSPSRFDVVDSDTAPGAVSRQSPPGGSNAPRGATVTLEVAVAPGEAVTVPDVVGMKQDAAVNALHDAGLQAHVTEQQSPDDGPKGRVWKQSPQPGTNVSQGTTVTIFVTPA